MKNTIHSAISSAFCFAALMLGSTYVFSQPVVPPNLSDKSIITGCGEGFGTAMINYGTTTSSAPTNVIFGAAWESNCPTSFITVTDVGTGSVATCMPGGGPGWSYSSIPDVAIGNASTPGNFVMAVAYSRMSGGSTYIMVDFYDITGAGGPLAVSFHSSSMVAALPVSINGEDVHIDIIAEHPATHGALPNCQKFGLTFEDQGGSGNLFIAEGNVSAYYVGPSCPIASGTQMDIAAIQRNVAPAGPPVVHDYALLTWISNTGNVMYGEYDLTAMTCAFVPGTIQTVETPGAPYLNFTSPRIDGDDDYTTNTPTPSRMVYELAYQANTALCTPGSTPPYANTATIHSFNNVYTTPWDPTTGLSGGVGSFNPVTVQAGEVNYDIFHWSGGYFTGTPCYSQQAGAMMMEPLNDGTGMMSGFPYYEVSTGIYPGVAAPNIYDNLIYTWHFGEWSVSASKTCNTANQSNSLILYAWVQLGVIGTSAPQGAMYKLSPSGPYGFREANQITGTIGASQKMLLSPNPNNGSFTLTGTVPTDKATDEATVEIMDILGNTVFTDKTVVNGGTVNMQVNLGNNFASGMYLARLHCGSSNQIFKFTIDK